MQETRDSSLLPKLAGATKHPSVGELASESETPRNSLAAGTIRILGQSRYELKEFVTKGGMGAVYRAWDHHLNRQVAVKCLLDVTREGSKNLASQEARTLASLAHPNILRVYDILIEDEQVWIVSEWVEGLCLAEILITHNRLPEPIVIAVMAQVFSALGATHSSNVFHRDIKPANIMVGKNGQITLIDFGVAYSPGFSTGETLVGSLRYTDPRILEGSAPDSRSDLFSAAMMQMELMTGEKVLPDLAPLPLYRHISKNLVGRLAGLGDGCYPPLTNLITRLTLPSTKIPAEASISALEASKVLTEMLRQFTDMTPEALLTSYLASEKPVIDSVCTQMVSFARETLARSDITTREKADWISFVSVATETRSTQLSKNALSSDVTQNPFWSMAKKLPAINLKAVRRHKWAEVWLALVVISLAFAVRYFNNVTPTVHSGSQATAIISSDSLGDDSAKSTLRPRGANSDLGSVANDTMPVNSAAVAPKSSEVAVLAATFPIHIVANAWANISVNGRELGQIPSAKPFLLTAGIHKIHAESPFVEPLDTTIEVGTGKSEKIQLTLKAKLAPRVIKLATPGQLFVDGVDYGVVESKALTLTYGKHEIIIKRGNQVIRPPAVTVSPETPAEIRVEQ